MHTVDSKWLQELTPHLKGLKLHAKIDSFDDRRLVGGDDWDAEIKAALDQADIVVLLVTANFIGSEYIHRVELPTALRRRAADGAVVLPVLLESCARKLLQIDDINYLPKDSSGALKPLSEWRAPAKARALTQITEHLIAQIERRREQAKRQADTARRSGIDIAIYRQRAHSRWSAVDLAALATPGAFDADISIRLADVFVPQRARRNRPPLSLPHDYLEKQGIDPAEEAARAEEIATAWNSGSPVEALDLIGECRERNLVLLGDPGAGKSALTRYVLLQLLGDAPQIPAKLVPLAGYVPFLIELRDFIAREAEGRCTDLVSYLDHCGRELGFGFDIAQIEHQFANQPTLLIVDGLDEIFDPTRRRLIVEQIIGLTSRNAQLRLLITSRIAGFDEHPLRAAGFAIATVIDLSAGQIKTFANAWFAIVFPGDEAAAARARDDLLDTVQRRPQLGVIAGNPMILTIMATVARHKRLARSRTAIYAQALELLSYNWDYRRGLGLPPDSPLIDLQAEDTILMLRRIAWRMQEEAGGLRANAVSEAVLRDLLEEFFIEEWRFAVPKARRAASEMVKRLEERNWVLTLRGPGLYGFVHRTFLEYLCALELTERFKAQQLDIDTLISSHVIPRVDDDAWHEVLRLLAGALPVTAAERMLLGIAPASEEVMTHGGFVLAWQALAEIEPRQISSLRGICGRLTDLLYSWLSNLGGYRSSQIASVIIETLNAIGEIRWPAPHPPVRNWPDFPRGQFSVVFFNVLVALAKTIWSCRDEVISFTLSAVETSNGFVRASALTALGEHFPTHRKAKALLVFHATKDTEPYVRAAALTALTRGLPREPETKAVLLTRAYEDPEPGPRETAVTMLGYYFAREPDAKPTLSKAVCDTSAPVRRAASLAIASGLSPYELRVVASRDLDGLPPGIDPREPITPDAIAAAAAKLGKSEQEIRTLFEQLAREVPLTFSSPGLIGSDDFTEEAAAALHVISPTVAPTSPMSRLMRRIFGEPAEKQ